MNNASKIDTNWTKIFNKYPILQTIKDEGKYIITAQQIKEFWEPRLMTKHDHSVNRPQIFIDNSLSILPITRGSYIIGAMDLYHDFALSDREKVFDSTDSMPVSSPAFIESIDFNNITSEATAINSIYVSDILRDFLNEPTLLPTVNGRMGAGSFSFSVNCLSGEDTSLLVDVSNSQIEIDGGYEGTNSLCLIEAKSSLSTDFLVRQLYYPFRLWTNKITKPIRPVFLLYIYCEIDGGLQTVDHELKVGDLIYSNGALASVDDNAPVSDDCVGVVYFVGNPMPSVLYPFTEDNEFTYSERQDALLRDHPGCTHGLVLGLKENTNIVFGEKDEIRVWYRTEFAERNSYIDLSPMGWDGSASTGTLNGTSRDQRLGYNHTEVIKKYAEAKNKSLLVNSLNNYNLVAPSISSGWFIPSVGDLRAMVTNWETMNTQLGKITGSDGLKNDMYYWSSTERNNTSIFGVQLTSSGSTKVDGLKYDRPGVSSRYVFAF